ncbi:MAG TPA: FMN reductase [Nocardioidaceae bacterium]|nr:FMN reductase [Nocardioidaceae bacterium]
MSTRTIAVVSAGLSQPSSTRLLADQLAEAVVRRLAEDGVEAKVEVVELREHAHDLANNLLTHFPNGELREVIDTVTQADGLIAVTPIFTASYSGLFKMFFDVLDKDALAGKPVLAGATGGTARHSLALEHAVRPMFAYLRGVVVPTSVYAASEDWGTGGTGGTALADRIDRAADELAALVANRPADQPADPFEDPTPFEQLLAGR